MYTEDIPISSSPLTATTTQLTIRYLLVINRSLYVQIIDTGPTLQEGNPSQSSYFDALFLFFFPKGKCSFRLRFFTSSSTTDESVDGGVSAPARTTTGAASTGADSLLDVELEVVDNQEIQEKSQSGQDLLDQLPIRLPDALVYSQSTRPHSRKKLISRRSSRALLLHCPVSRRLKRRCSWSYRYRRASDLNLRLYQGSLSGDCH